MNTAMPSAIGVAMSSASTDEYSVPQMNGSAPNSPATGSQISVSQKLRPNLRIDAIDSTASTAPMVQTMATTRSPKAPVPSRKPSSLRDLDLGKGGHFELDDRLRQRRVAEIGAVLLAVDQRPLHEVDHRLEADEAMQR